MEKPTRLKSTNFQHIVEKQDISQPKDSVNYTQFKSTASFRYPKDCRVRADLKDLVSVHKANFNVLNKSSSKSNI